jgi:hypothetical protein
LQGLWTGVFGAVLGVRFGVPLIAAMATWATSAFVQRFSPITVSTMTLD